MSPLLPASHDEDLANVNYLGVGSEAQPPRVRSLPRPPHPATRVRPGDNHPMKVLVAEDDKKASEMLRWGLSEAGIAADVVNNGQEAIARGTFSQGLLERSWRQR
jgi:hypothetical protein